MIAATLQMPVAAAHPERATQFPNPDEGAVPRYSTDGDSHVVCSDDSQGQIRELNGDLRDRNERLLEDCQFGQIQAAVDAASSGDRILILPGLYEEPTARERPISDPSCDSDYTWTTHGDARGTPPSKYRVPTYDYHRGCPNSRNLVAVIGDADGDRRCDTRCNLLIEGTGGRPEDVVIRGDRRKMDVVHVDRADGIFLRNFTVEHGAFNGINVIETNGFRLERIVARHNQNYGVLTFTTDHGLYDRVVAYGNGHAGLYPGSTAEGHDSDGDCARHPIEMRRVESYGNTYGYSGTGANAVWVHHSSFHHNSTGISTDSTATSHPGMPQDCAVFERNRIYSNNLNPFGPDRHEECERPFHERDPIPICPYFPAPVGTGIQIAGGNDNAVERNAIYDNWRSGVRLFAYPAPLRAERDPTKALDTSHRNRFVRNRMGIAPGDELLPNGEDFWWDEEGRGNCWRANRSSTGGAPSSDPATLPPCPAGSSFGLGDPLKVAEQAPCATYDPRLNREPPGCAWLTTPEPPG